MYDVAAQQIQVWRYDPELGWQKYTRDVPVAFADGDSFNVRALPNGRVVIYRNGDELARPPLAMEDQAQEFTSIQPVSYRLSALAMILDPQGETTGTPTLTINDILRYLFGRRWGALPSRPARY